MYSFKILFLLTLVFMAVSINVAEGAPLFWDLFPSRIRTGKNHVNQDNGSRTEYGKLCNVFNPTDWNNGQFQPANCPP